jgi:hypothetical protein
LYAGCNMNPVPPVRYQSGFGCNGGANC